MTYQFLHEVSPGIFYLDHRLTPEVRAMLAAMASRAPKGGIRARYQQIVKAVAEGLLDEEDAECSDERLQQAKESVERMGGTWDRKTRVNIRLSLAEHRLCEYPLHPKVQEFFDQFVRDYGHSCYDEDTEVLARVEGMGVCWLPWAKAYEWRLIDENHMSPVHVELAAFDPETDSIHFEEPIGWVSKTYTGPMYRVKTERGTVDLLVTPNHRMCVRKREYVGTGRDGVRYEWSGWRAELANDVEGKTNYRYKRGASKFTDTQPIPSQADPWGLSDRDLFGFGQLCGFFIGDGYAGGKQTSYLSFHIRKDREVQFLEQLESRLNLRVLHHKTDKHHISLAGARDWAREHFYDQEGVKQIPDWAVQGPELFVRGLLEGLHNSDGFAITEDSWQLFSSSQQVMEAAQILGTLWGNPVAIRDTVTPAKAEHKQMRTATFSGWRNQEPVVNRGAKDDGWVDYDGRVYCAQVSTGFLVVRRNFSTMISGNSILELSGNPAVYTENISWFTAWLLFDSPLCSGQEFSTRAVRHKDWPMARECFEPGTFETPDRTTTNLTDGPLVVLGAGDVPEIPPLYPHPALKTLHDGWFEVFEAEVEWWRGHLSDKANRDALGIADKEPFRPALDRARWAIPGTIATGCCHTGHLRERSRVLHDGMLLAQKSQSPAAIRVWDDIKKGYEKALPGMAGMGLREAVYHPGHAHIPGHLILSTVRPAAEVQLHPYAVSRRMPDTVYRRPRGERAYVDPYFNDLYHVEFVFQCSLAVSRDWHRHRTVYPWTLSLVRGLRAGICIHPAYEPKSDVAKKRAPELLAQSTKAFDIFMADGDQMRAMLCLPLGTHVQMAGQAGLRDAVYMLELRHWAVGACFEYRDQAAEAIRQLAEQLPPEVLDRIGLIVP